MIKVIFGAIALLVVGSIVYLFIATGGDGNSAASVVREETLTCASGQSIHTQFLSNNNMVLTIGNTPYELTPVVAASGARYANSDESFVFWNQGNESIVLVNGETMYEGCRNESAVGGTPVTTEPIVNGYALSFVLPQGATHSLEAERFHKILYAGVNNEPPALTDGFTVTLTLLTKMEDVDFRTFVENERDDISNAAEAELVSASFYGRESFQFTHETELGTIATEHYVHVDDETVMRATVSAVGANAQQYRASIEALLQSISFRHVGNSGDVSDLIQLELPKSNDVIESPLTLEGDARGQWYFEATFPISLTNWDGLIIAEGYAEAQDDWMTTEFVPFEASLEFENPYTAGDPDFMKRGTLILHKSNASGLPEHDAALEIPVLFAE